MSRFGQLLRANRLGYAAFGEALLLRLSKLTDDGERIPAQDASR